MGYKNDRRAALKKLKLLSYNGKVGTENFRKRIDDAFKVVFLPNNVECSEYKYGNIVCDILSPEIYASNRVMLYIHGGSFVGGSRSAYRSFCSSLASKCYCRVVIPEFRLAPSNPYPAATDDIQNVFKALFTEEQIACSLNSQNGHKMEPEIIIAADGSSASIACSLIFNLRERYRKQIKKVILFSPWLDLSPDSRIFSAKKISDEVLNGDSIKKSTVVYTYESNTKRSAVSPLRASEEDLENFPSTIIQMGGKELLLPDAQDFAEKLKAAGNEVILDVWPDMMFMFQLADEFLRESHLALDKIGRIITNMDETSAAIQIDNKPVLENSLKSEA
ncbi:MAG: alpha/beta hydrolase fold domain-containing protein [Treponema sp.]|nr:alpha/beta hydrolase [Spirochaetia bacterium]MDY2840261.1 alpha/beta hydrolase fold domain-containing protein [Treponema sp.]